MGKFSNIFDTHLKNGIGREASKQAPLRGRWSNATFAAEPNDIFSSRSVADWRKGFRLPTDSNLEVIMDRLFGPDPSHMVERDELREALRQDRRDNDGVIIRSFGTNAEHPDNLPPDAVNCYEALFPKDERVLWEDIYSWLEIAHNAPDHEWVELFFTMQRVKKCIGIAYISLYRPRRWFFGNYYGIMPRYRSHDEARRLLENVAITAERITPTAEGIVFEVERFDHRLLDGVLARCEAKEWKPAEKIELSDDERFSLLAARRIQVYTTHGLARTIPIDDQKSKRMPGCLAIMARHVDGSLTLQPYRQPVMDKDVPLTEENELELALLIYPFNDMLKSTGMKIDPDIEHPWPLDKVYNILDFLYTHSYGSVYTQGYRGGTAANSFIPGFGDYIPLLLDRVREAFNEHPTVLVSRKILPSSARTLFTRYKTLMKNSGITL